MRFGRPHLISTSYYVFLAIGFLAIWLLLRRHLNLNRLTCALLLALVGTDPVVLCGGTYFRSAKPGSATLLLVACCILCAVFVRRSPFPAGFRRGVVLVAVPLLLLMSCLFDEQGVLMTAMLAVLLVTEWRVSSNPNAALARDLLIGVSATLVVFAFYDVIGHPWLSQHFGTPIEGMGYQTETFQGLLVQSFARLGQAGLLLLDQFRYLTGLQSGPVAAFMVIWLVAACSKGAAAGAGSQEQGKGV